MRGERAVRSWLKGIENIPKPLDSLNSSGELASWRDFVMALLQLEGAAHVTASAKVSFALGEAFPGPKAR